MELRPGQRVRVRQVVERREGSWTLDVTGEVLEAGPEPTGSWYAHGKDDRYWLRRLRIRKDGGEVTTLTIDRHTHVELLGEASEARAAASG